MACSPCPCLPTPTCSLERETCREEARGRSHTDGRWHDIGQVGEVGVMVLPIGISGANRGFIEELSRDVMRRIVAGEVWEL